MTPEEPVRLLLAEDQVMIRQALAALLEFEGDIEVVAQVGRGDEVVQAADSTKPDVAVLDIEMPGLDGLAAAAELKRHHPGIKIVILTTFGRPGFLRRAMESGESLTRNADTPDSIARRRKPGRPNVVRMTILIPGWCLFSSAAAARPSMPGISMSSTATSGLTASAAVSTSSPRPT